MKFICIFLILNFNLFIYSDETSFQKLTNQTLKDQTLKDQISNDQTLKDQNLKDRIGSNKNSIIYLSPNKPSIIEHSKNKR